MERFRSAVEALPDGMVILDATNRIEWANVRAQAHLGIDLGRDAGRPLLNFVRQPEVVRYLETGDFTDAVVVDSLRDCGDDAGDPGRAVRRRGAIADQPQHHADRSGGAHAPRFHRQRVSHELKTPLTVISGFLETLQDLDLEPATAHALSCS